MKRIIMVTSLLTLLILTSTILVSAQSPTVTPGLYVTDLQISPNPQVVGSTFKFTASFQNTATGDQNMKWRVAIYRAAAPQNSYSDTTWLMSTVAPGTSTLLSDGSWTVPLGTPCDYYFARVVWMDSNNQSIPFKTTDGKVYEKGFTTCPPPPTTTATTSSATPAASATPIAPPGLYVTDLQISPNPPTVGNTFTFTAAFLNTANGDQNITWRVTIYRAAADQKSYTDTTWLRSTFAPGTANKLSDGDWWLPTGTLCDYYYARVVWIDSNNQSIPFTMPDGKVFQKGFNTCGSATSTSATTSSAASSASATPIAPAGLYVTDLQISPTPPKVGNTFTFTASFVNTANGDQNMKWRVAIYRAAADQTSYTDTTWLLSTFAPGTSTKLSDGDWWLPTGNPCDYYYARVVWMDNNNQSIPFTMPDGKVFQKGFNTCN